MNTKVEHGNYKKSEPSTMTSILIIEYATQETKPLSFWKSRLPRLKIELLGESPARTVLYVHHADSQEYSAALRLVQASLHKDLRQANWIHLSDPHFCIQAEPEGGYPESYSIPEPLA